MSGRVALVTGGSRGIGRACVAALARSGHAVVVHYHRNEEAARAVLEVVRATGVDGRLIAADLASPAEAQRLFREAEASFGRLDVLVSNAGVAPTTGLDAITLDEWRSVLDTNVTSAFLIARLALQGMRRRGFGRVVMIASQAGLTGGYFVGAHYAASKGALIALTRSLAKTAARQGGDVTVNCVAPGLVDTDLVQGFPADQREAMVSGIPMRRLGTAEEVAAAVAFLASEAASYLTGVVLPVDGGLLAG